MKRLLKLISLLAFVATVTTGCAVNRATATADPSAKLDTLKKIKIRWGVKDTELMWPYFGEYWRDELGTYELDFSMCRASGNG